MKKSFVILTALLMVFGFMTTTSMAASVISNAPALGAVVAKTVAKELVTAAGYDYATQASGNGLGPVWVKFEGTGTLGATSKITFTLTNGYFNNSLTSGSYVLFESSGGSALWATAAGRNLAPYRVANIIAGGTGTSSLTLQVNTGKVVDPAKKYYLAYVYDSSSTSSDFQEAGDIYKTDINYKLLPALASPGSLSISVTEVKDANGSVVAAGNVGAVTVASTKTSIGLYAHNTVTFGTVSENQIKVKSNRVAFSNDGTTKTATSYFSIVNMSPLGTLAALDKALDNTQLTAVKLTLKGNFTGVKMTNGKPNVTLKIDGGTITPDTSTYTAGNGGSGAYEMNVTTAANITTLINNTATDGLVIEVDGSTTLSTRTFTMDGAFTITSGYGNVSAADVTVDRWTVDGYQAIIPYLSTNTTYGTQILLNNGGTSSADVFFDLVSSTDATIAASLSSYSNKQVTGKATIAAGKSQLYDAAELITALGLTPDTNISRNAVRVTVTAPVASVTGQAIQSDGTTGKRTQPLLKAGGQNEYLVD